MSAEHTYDYSIVRVVPRVDRGERINVGVILSCSGMNFLDARIEARRGGAARARSRRRYRRDSREPGHDSGGVPRRAGAGPIGVLPARGRFRWLVSPRSTIIQPSAVHRPHVGSGRELGTPDGSRGPAATCGDLVKYQLASACIASAGC